MVGNPNLHSIHHILGGDITLQILTDALDFLNLVLICTQAFDTKIDCGQSYDIIRLRILSIKPSRGRRSYN